MYFPKYSISNSVLRNIGVIEACREVVESAPLIPAYEKRFRAEATARSVHHGTHIEGNDLSLEQARQILEVTSETNAEKAIEKHGFLARERDVQEVINYREVMEWIDVRFNKVNSQKGSEQFYYKEEEVGQVHKLVVYRLVDEASQGVYRKTQVVLRDSATGEVTFRPPPAIEVSYLMEDFIKWLNSASGHEVHPVLRAGISHYAIASIHPFVEGNGRTARAFATLVLFVEGFDIRRLFSLEEYFDRDASGYYKTLIATSSQSKDLSQRDLTTWLEYFTYGLSLELSRIRDKVKKLSLDLRIKRRRGEQVMLSERQIKAVEYIGENGQGVMGELRGLFPEYSEDTVLRDLQDLVLKDIIKKKGRTKGAYYELVT